MSLPSGTVTFLFTDIEGSTKLAQAHPDKWETLRERHHAILHQAMQAYNGHVFQIVGDEFCVAFHTAIDAVRAAAEAQRMLHAEPWEPVPIKVRMGIHSGTANFADVNYQSGGYKGYTAMARVQRIMSAANGEQVLISLATKELMRDELPEEMSLRDMGARRLKDLNRPEEIFQLIIPNLPTDFPPLKTLDAYRHNLPTQMTTFIGREKEMAEVKHAIANHRLITLSGVGGTGKTRLALQVAADLIDEFPDGVWLMELAPLSDPALIPQAVATTLRLREQKGRTILEMLKDFLSGQKTLLILDNCEHLIEACAQLADGLLHTAPHLKILATSREALGIAGESTYPVRSLSLPDPQHASYETLSQYEAVCLFIDRAISVQPNFQVTNQNAPSVAQVCSRLDGIPLAIELAAARVKGLGVEQIASRLNDRFRLLTGGSRTALPRQRTLQATIDWSYKLLSEEERVLLRRLSVFVGGWTIEAAEQICAGDDIDPKQILDLLLRLVDKSLVMADTERSEPRYHLLETIRQYAQEKLDEIGAGEQTRARHLEYCIGLAEKVEQELHGIGQVEWLQKIETEYENMRAALEWSLQENIHAGQRLAAALWRSWSYNGNFREGYKWLERMLAATPGEETLTRAKMLAGAGSMAGEAGMREEVLIEHSEASVDLFRKLGHEEDAAYPLATLAVILFFRHEHDKAMELAKESREWFISSGNKWGVEYPSSTILRVLMSQGKFEEAQKLCDENLAICNEIGDIGGRGAVLYWMGRLAQTQGNITRAAELYEEGLDIARSVRNTILTIALLERTGRFLLQLGNYEKSRVLFEEELDVARRANDLADIYGAMLCLGLCARLEGNFTEARSYYMDTLQGAKQFYSHNFIAELILDIGVLFGKEGNPEKFVRILGAVQGLAPYILDSLIEISRIDTRQFIETARAALGEEAYTAAYEAGKKMTLDEAVAYTLKELEQ